MAKRGNLSGIASRLNKPTQKRILTPKTIERKSHSKSKKPELSVDVANAELKQKAADQKARRAARAERTAARKKAEAVSNAKPKPDTVQSIFAKARTNRQIEQAKRLAAKDSAKKSERQAISQADREKEVHGIFSKYRKNNAKRTKVADKKKAVANLETLAKEIREKSPKVSSGAEHKALIKKGQEYADAYVAHHGKETVENSRKHGEHLQDMYNVSRGHGVKRSWQPSVKKGTVPNHDEVGRVQTKRHVGWGTKVVNSVSKAYNAVRPGKLIGTMAGYNYKENFEHPHLETIQNVIQERRMLVRTIKGRMRKRGFNDPQRHGVDANHGQKRPRRNVQVDKPQPRVNQ